MSSALNDFGLFEIDVGAEALADLRARLDRSRWPPAKSGSDWSDGANVDFLRQAISYWRDGFDWQAQQTRLNSYPQYRVNVDGAQIHFLHIRSVDSSATPILLTHGWPGTYIELLKVVERLQKNGATGGVNFHLVVPSIPGFGFSRTVADRSHSMRDVAELWHALMLRLGYSRYLAHGGDWGAGISVWLARLHPTAVLGLHLNFLPGSYSPWLGAGSPPLSAAEENFQSEKASWLNTEGAYGHIQSTKPLTPAYALNDSPMGLAAWILEKFQAWSDCDGDPRNVFSLDELLTNVSIYWFTQSISTSMQLYKASKAAPHVLGPGERIAVPLAFAEFPKEVFSPPREWVDRGFEVARWTKMTRGGHFAALEQPDLLASDIAAFAESLVGSGLAS